jgi:hypothetical protein
MHLPDTCGAIPTPCTTGEWGPPCSLSFSNAVLAVLPPRGNHCDRHFTWWTDWLHSPAWLLTVCHWPHAKSVHVSSSFSHPLAQQCQLGWPGQRVQCKMSNQQPCIKPDVLRSRRESSLDSKSQRKTSRDGIYYYHTHTKKNKHGSCRL